MIFLSFPSGSCRSCCWCDYIQPKIGTERNSKTPDSFSDSDLAARTRGFCPKRNILESLQNGRFGALGSCCSRLSWCRSCCSRAALALGSRLPLMALSCGRRSWLSARGRRSHPAALSRALVARGRRSAHGRLVPLSPSARVALVWCRSRLVLSRGRLSCRSCRSWRSRGSWCRSLGSRLVCLLSLSLVPLSARVVPLVAHAALGSRPVLCGARGALSLDPKTRTRADRFGRLSLSLVLA
jgi:hypothetical protein